MLYHLCCQDREEHEPHHVTCEHHPFFEHFQTARQDSANWVPMQSKHPLAMRVLAVALTRIEGAWTAYIDAVPGLNHDLEAAGVLRHGEKLGEDIALALFPQFRGVPYAR